jgi:predicted RNase H-like nuclease
MIAGVDGCKGGWLVALASGWPCPAPPRLVLCEDFRTVLDVTAGCAAVAVDMPIGFSDDTNERVCDKEARKHLTGKHSPTSRVFRMPPRGALCASSWKEFQKLQFAISGKRASKQVWAITPTLCELDHLINPRLQSYVVESHPELAFTRLTGNTLLPKHYGSGLGQRIAAFAVACPLALHALGKLPEGPKLDDALDALVLLSVAAHVAEVDVDASPELARRVPKVPFEDIPRDARGLRMGIWF